MRKALVLVFILIGLIVNSFIFSPSNICCAQTNEIYVNDDGDYPYRDGTGEYPLETIQEAIDMAEEGDTIFVYGGTYQEVLDIDKSVKIVGSIEEGDTVIDIPSTIFGQKRYGVEINADSVTLENFKITDTRDGLNSPISALLFINSVNNVIQGLTFEESDDRGIFLSDSSNGNVISGSTFDSINYGIYCYFSQTNDVYNNVFTGCVEDSIYMENSDRNRIYGNSIYNCKNSIYALNSEELNITNNVFYEEATDTIEYYGIYLSNCNDAKIIENDIFNCGFSGIYLSSDDANIYDNYINNNKRGIELFGDNSLIKNNRISNSTASGIYAGSNSNSNVICSNRIFLNGKNAQENGDNSWDNGSIGNYWGDYNEVDLKPNNLGDGIGDVPYSKNGLVDNYPTGYFLKAPLKPSNPSPSDGASGTSLTVTLKVKVQDVDSDMINVDFYKADGTLIGNAMVPDNSYASCTISLPFNTTYAWYTIANDSRLETQSDIWLFSTRATPPDNKPPTADFTYTPQNPEIGETITFDGTLSSDQDGTIDFYRWNFDDSTSEIISEEPTHTFLSPLTYSVTLTVIDNDGSTDSCTKNIEVLSPDDIATYTDMTLELNLPSSGDVGENIDFEGTLSGGESPYDWSWDFGDGESSNEQNPTHKYDEENTYTVSLTVTDNRDNQITEDTEINIQSKEVGSTSKDTPGFNITIILLAIITTFVIFQKKR